MKRVSTLLAFVIIVIVIALSGCSTTDSKQDLLANYDSNVVLPFDTRNPEASTPTPEPTATIEPTPVPQDWQDDTPPPVYEPVTTPKPSMGTYSMLQEGDQGSDVKRLQERLIELKYLSGTADGRFGSQTKEAVKRFQSQLGLSQTGVATASLQESLFRSNAPQYSGPSIQATQATKTPGIAATTAAAESTPRPYSTLRRGDSGQAVLNLQRRLIELGYLPSGSADGRYGSQTITAVKHFQEMLGADQTGNATGYQQERLYAANAPTPRPTSVPTPKPTQPPTPTPAPIVSGQYSTLLPGSSGQAVRNLQNRLIELGYLSGVADGDYGSQTTAAVKRFQAALNLETTGITTGQLQEMLYSPTAPTFKPASTPAATAAPAQYVELKYGDTGTRVQALQLRLKELGYFNGELGGNYLNITMASVKLFQAAINMQQTGIATVAMQEALFAADAPRYSAATAAPTPAPSRFVELKYGDTGERVRAMQARLMELGYFEGELGGNFLNITTASVKLFQAAMGMQQTGVATVAMQEALFADDAPIYRPNVTPPATAFIQLSFGDAGEEVRNLQKRLALLGFLANDEINIDGIYGEATRLAVMAFEIVAGAAPQDASGVATIEFQQFLFSEGALEHALMEPGQ